MLDKIKLFFKIPKLYFFSKNILKKIEKNKENNSKVDFLRKRETLKNKWSQSVLNLLKVKYKIEFPEDLGIAEDENYILISNHRSMVDIVLIQLIQEKMPNKKTLFIAKEELLKMPIIGSVLLNMGGIAINRGSNSGTLKLLKEIKKQNKENNNMYVLFPEGTRTRKEEYNLGDFKPGIDLIVKKFKFKILPVYIEGQPEKYLEKLEKDQSPLKVKVGKVFDKEEDKTVEEMYKEFVSNLK
ncbi:1-acyl-sn-glycerol-3-phosphate acyltransferase [bacterium]|jgi:1-acyl-sn-glycerol-3-phosphate acyltransferase|nr:1-acyl-sn-glycerol-3-phosphate acyltransferase [bacterium]